MNRSNPLLALQQHGQSFWWDSLSRHALDNGEIARMRDENGLRGITSNPTIFHEAIASGNDYDPAIETLAGQGLDAEDVFWRLAVEDVRRACDLLRPVYDDSDGTDGLVSLEVDPRLARDAHRSIDEARRLWKETARPNLMIKIPGTPEGLDAIRRGLVEGINVNITLLFSTKAHVDVMRAYFDAMQTRLDEGESLASIASVASFFVSRVDTMVDERLEEIGGERAPSLRGKTGVANARLAYEKFEAMFTGEEWHDLEAAGARVQRPLWASTSTKNDDYSDVLYVKELIGPRTVNTMNTATIEAWADHGEAEADTIRRDVEGAKQHFRDLEEVGVDMGDVTDRLLDQGIEKFADSYDELIGAISEKMDALGRRGASATGRAHSGEGGH